MPNQVLTDDFKTSPNFYHSDLMLQDWLSGNLPALSLSSMHDNLVYSGQTAAIKMDSLSIEADKNPPQLVKRDQYGRDVNQVKFHPAYDELLRIAVNSGMLSIKWDDEKRDKNMAWLNTLGFSTGYLFAMSELGLYCPLCMTDGVAKLIQKYGDEDDKNRLLSRIGTEQPEMLFTGAMFLTEKSGGSDVGANLVNATHSSGKYYHLNGEKWFCSNANADIIMVLARTDASIKGTKGLSIFLVEKNRPDGTPNHMNIVRLKDKLGVRSMASAEVILENTTGKLIGQPFEGFAIMADMINLSRLYNSIAALSGARRATIEAYQFLCHRNTFGKRAVEHPLVREKLMEIGAMQTANFYLTWRTILALDHAESGDEKEKQLVRILTPMTKLTTAREGVYIVRESMELMGGLGYIEDTVMPKIMRDMMVLPIWEGAENIMVLDMVRAAGKGDSLQILIQLIENQVVKDSPIDSYFRHFKKDLFACLKNADREKLEYSARALFQKLTLFTKYALLRKYAHEGNKAWTEPTVSYFEKMILGEDQLISEPVTTETIKGLMAWNL